MVINEAELNEIYSTTSSIAVFWTSRSRLDPINRVAACYAPHLEVSQHWDSLASEAPGFSWRPVARLRSCAHKVNSVDVPANGAMTMRSIGPQGEREKSMKVASAVAASMLAAILSSAAHAFPGSPSRNDEVSIMMHVGGGCGKGNHRTNAGQCVSGQAAKVQGLSSGACPPGSHLGNKGRGCRQND
jgi:hypothetical protein